MCSLTYPQNKTSSGVRWDDFRGQGLVPLAESNTLLIVHQGTVALLSDSEVVLHLVERS
jgi:hypothetical protein